MQGIEVIFGNGVRKVWRANGFYLEQTNPGTPDGRVGSTSPLVVSRAVPRYPNSNSAETIEAPQARIPLWCFVGRIELDEDGKSPARIHEDTGWELPEAEAEPELVEPLPVSDIDPRSKLPRAPRKLSV